MVRNYVVLHQFVPITSGAGSLYIVTRPQSDGLFDGAGAKEWLALSTDEAVRNERAFSLAVKAIADHPFYFLSTIVRKPFYLFGQDIKNLYWNLEHAHGKLDSSEQYDLYYAMSNGFYLGIVLLICLWVMRGEYIRAATPALILLWLFTIYPIFAHSLFEAAERHRYGALPFMAIFAAMALSPGGRRVNVDFHDTAAVAGVLPSAWRGLARPRS